MSILAAEMRFKIKFKTSEVESLHTVGHLADMIEVQAWRRSNRPVHRLTVKPYAECYLIPTPSFLAFCRWR